MGAPEAELSLTEGCETPDMLPSVGGTIPGTVIGPCEVLNGAAKPDSESVGNSSSSMAVIGTSGVS